MILHLVPEDRLIDPVAAAAAILLRPAHADIAGGAELAPERLGEIGGPHALLGRVAMRLPDVWSQLAAQEVLHLKAERLFFGRQFKVHACSLWSRKDSVGFEAGIGCLVNADQLRQRLVGVLADKRCVLIIEAKAVHSPGNAQLAPLADHGVIGGDD